MTHKLADHPAEPAASASRGTSGGQGSVALARMRRLIGGAFGLVYVVVGAGGLSSATPALRIAAIAAFIGLLIMARRTIVTPGDPAQQTTPFNRGYLVIVTAEVAAIAAGVVILEFALHAPHAFYGWVTLVVGVHFFGLAHVWRREF